MILQGPFQYFLTSEHFSINVNTGKVYTKVDNIDYEQKKDYALSVTVKDRGGLSASLQAKVCAYLDFIFSVAQCQFFCASSYGQK